MSDNLAAEYADQISGPDWLESLEVDFEGDWFEWLNHEVLEVKTLVFESANESPKRRVSEFHLVTGTGGPHSELILRDSEYARIGVWWGGDHEERSVRDERLPELFGLLVEVYGYEY